MLTYEEALKEVASRLGERAYHKWMGGSNEPWHYSGITEASMTLAVVYNMDEGDIDHELTDAAHDAFDFLVGSK